MQNNNRNKITHDEEINISELISIIWSGRNLIASITALVAIISVIYTIQLPNIYKSQALLVIVEENDTNKNSLAAYSNLANIAGINLGGQTSDRKNEVIEIVKSRKFINDFITQRSILAPLMAVKSWNKKTGELEIDGNIYDETNQEWITNFATEKSTEPTAAEAYKAFNKIFAIDVNENTGFISIEINHYSPTISQKWLQWIVEDVNTSFKDFDQLQANKSIKYLKQEISKTSVTNLQNLLFNLIQKQTEILMLTNIRDEYVLRTIDPPVIPEKKFSPKRSSICILNTLFAAFLSVILTLVLGFLELKIIFTPWPRFSRTDTLVS